VSIDCWPKCALLELLGARSPILSNHQLERTLYGESAGPDPFQN
jgi:hypothetical protein